MLVPCALALAFWLGLFHMTRPMAWRWLLLLATVASLVAFSKLAFMAWGIGVPSLNFTGISGHAAMSATVWPAFLALLGRGSKRNLGIIGAVAGLLFAMTVAMSRVVLHAHSWAEVLAGFSLGATAASAFLWRLGPRWRLQDQYWSFTVTLLLIFSVTYRYRFPSEHLLHVVAQHLSLGEAIYTRRYFHDHHE